MVREEKPGFLPQRSDPGPYSSGVHVEFTGVGGVNGAHCSDRPVRVFPA